MSKSYSYDIQDWNPINVNSFNLITTVKIKPDVNLLDLFKLAPFHNILCKISGTDSDYDNKIVYGKIEKSLTEADSRWITLDHVWKSYPTDKKGKIEFFPDTVYKTIDYLTEPNANPVIKPDEFNIPMLNLLYNSDNSNNSKKLSEHGNVTSSRFNSSLPSLPSSLPLVSLSTEPKFCSNPRMKLSDMLIPIGVSLVCIGLLNYVFPKKLFN